MTVMSHHALGRPGRLLAARLLPGQDVVEGVIGLIEAHGLASGTITALGSLRSATVVYARTMDFGDDPMSAAVFDRLDGPVELGVAQGVFGRDEEGRVVIHLHGLVMDGTGRMHCGNLLPGSAPVMATVDLTIQEFEGLVLQPTLDPAWKTRFLHPMAK
jgi:predicted DNA-binding protein with PD1-like motif